MKKALSKVFSVIGQIVAVVLVVALLLDYINELYIFLPEMGSKIIHYVVQYGATLLVAIIAMSAVLKTNMIFTVIMILLILAVVGFMFAKDIIVGYLPPAKSSTESAVIAALLL